MFDTPFCHVCYRPDLYVVYMQWKKSCSGNDYQDPFYYALYLLRKHHASHMIIDFSTSISTSSKDLEWTFREFIPTMAYTTCSEIVLIKDNTNLVFSDFNTLTKEFVKYFMVHQCNTFSDAIDAIY